MVWKGITVKFPEEDLKLIKKVAEARRESVSDFVRKAVRKELAELCFLPKEKKKALGIR
jgi:Arc/MetJ-type ribon-helix-helix transcriptional regulator